MREQLEDHNGFTGSWKIDFALAKPWWLESKALSSLRYATALD
jgi:hypothetical protein